VRRLPPKERDALLAEAAALAEPEYRANRRLTNSEAFREEKMDSAAVLRGDVT
jgi:hypothetical protein